MVRGYQRLIPLLAALLGVVAWSGPFPAIALAILVPALWALAESRWTAGIVVLGYQLGATWGLPGGILAFYGTFLALGVVLWIVAAVVIALIWAICWQNTKMGRVLWVPVPLILTALPPIGIVGWVHPINAAGALFPGWGWLGIIAGLVLALAVSAAPRFWLFGCVWALPVWAGLVIGPARGLPGWQGIDTRQEVGHGEMDPERDIRRNVELPKIALASSARVVVLPENSSGLWFIGPEEAWKRALAGSRDKTVLLGAELGEGDGRSANTLMAVDRRGASVAYRQRMPVPLTMWTPWAHDGTHAYWLDNPVVDVAGERAAVLICYEQVIVWPLLFSIVDHPTVVVAIANDWWAAGSTIPGIQKNCSISWARLFDLPLVTATNT